ncbi:MAG: hydroxymethylglutaryl-CoA reductase [Candidatus Daviesbacteria bacterium]|nr:hydroxymethylglutaryl-CoA reductase [Candidatus Daviesbacteria bacterium]
MSSKINLRDLKSAKKRREFLEKQLNISLVNTGQIDVAANVENLIGTTQIPLGVAGPLLIHLEGVKTHLRGVLHYIPLATTEGALVASVSRGCKAVTEAGGASVFVENIGITRGPVFKTKNLSESIKTKLWIEVNFQNLAKVAASTSSHLKLLKADYQVVGRNLFVRFYFDTADAMGMNMATIATQEAIDLIEKKTGAKCVSISGNFCIDKKPAWLNFISGRGKRVWAEVTLSKKILKDVLKTTPENIAEVVYRKCLLGSIMSGSLGFNGHYANIIAAIFAATGQDLAHTVEGSMGVTTAEVLENGDLYFSIYLPSLIVGTVGGGTNLPTQQEALKIMQAEGAEEFATVVGGAVLAGELSLIASLSEGSLVKAHQTLGRKGK